MRTYGTLSLETDKGARAWHLDVEPHVAMFAKRIFPRIQSGKRGVLILAHTAEVCRTLRWFMQRFPLNVDSPDTLEASSASHQERMERLDVGGAHVQSLAEQYLGRKPQAVGA